MAVVTTSLFSGATSASRATAYDSTGTQWVVLLDDTHTWYGGIQVWYSSDGETWTEQINLRFSPNGGADYRGVGLFIDWQDCAVVSIVTDAGLVNTSPVLWTAGETIADATGWEQVAGVNALQSWDPTATDVVMFQLSPTMRRIAWATTGDDCYLFWQDYYLSDNTKFESYKSMRTDVTPDVNAEFIGLDFEHVGDGLTAITEPNAFIVWRANNGVECMKTNWGVQGAWTMGPINTVSNVIADATSPLTCYFDGERFVMAFTDASNYSSMRVFEYNPATTDVTELPEVPPSGTEIMQNGSVSYNANKDIFLVVQGSGGFLGAREGFYDRALGTWSPWRNLEDAVPIPFPGTLTTARTHRGDFNPYVWTAGPDSPYSVMSGGFEPDLLQNVFAGSAVVDSLFFGFFEVDAMYAGTELVYG